MSYCTDSVAITETALAALLRRGLSRRIARRIIELEQQEPNQNIDQQEIARRLIDLELQERNRNRNNQERSNN